MSRPYQLAEKLFVSGRPSVKTFAECRPTAVLSLENRGITPAGFAYRHLHVPDGLVTVERQRQFEEAAAWVAEQLELGETVLVHCAQGRNRSMTVGALVLIRHFGFTVTDAIERVRAVRPTALYNPHQVSFLRSLEEGNTVGHVFILRGPSGSGKSYTGHYLAECFPHEEVFEDGWNKIKPRLIGYRLPGNFYLLGSYRPAGGGLDTLSPHDRTRHFELIRRYAAKGDFVFAEAMVLSSMVPKLLELGKELGPEHVSFPTLDTPHDICVKQVYQRNGGRLVKEENMRSHARSVHNGTRRLREAGLDAPDIDHTQVLAQVTELFRRHGWRPEDDHEVFPVEASRAV